MSQKTLLIIYLILFGGFLLWFLIWAYSPTTTHPALTQKSAEIYNQFYNGKLTNQEIAWLMEGAQKEDTPPRWINHFYDPTTGLGWQGERMGNLPSSVLLLFSKIALSPQEAVSALNWAQNQELQNKYRYYEGNQTWQKAIYEYAQGNKKEAYIALGHLLHLLQDMTVPAHTRQDTHVDLLGLDPGEPYEKWAAENIDFSHLTKFSSAQQAGADCNSLEDCFNKLARYSNENFFSENTILDKVYKLPIIIREEIFLDKAIYYGKNIDGNTEYPLVIFNRETKRHTVDDSLIHSAYWQLLSTKAVFGGAELVRIFHQEAEKAKQDQSLIEEPPKTSFFDLPVISLYGSVIKVGKFFQNAYQDVKNIFSSNKETPTIGELSVETVSVGFLPQEKTGAGPSIKTIEAGVAGAQTTNTNISLNALQNLLASLALQINSLTENFNQLISPRLAGGGGAPPPPPPARPVSEQTAEGNSSEQPPAEEPPEEPLPPPATPLQITNLSVREENHQIILTWTAPSNPENLPLNQLSYDIRYLKNNLITEDNWASATPIKNPPPVAESSTIQEVTLADLNYQTFYSFAIKIFDSQNSYPLSNVVSWQTSLPQNPAPWPMLSQNPAHTSQGLSEGPATSSILWSFQHQAVASIQYHAPIIDRDGTVYFTNSLGLYAFNSDGSLKWFFSAPAGLPPVIDNKRVIYFLADDKLYAVNADGTLAWRQSLARIYSTHLVLDENGDLFFLASYYLTNDQMSFCLIKASADGFLRCLYEVDPAAPPAVYPPDFSSPSIDTAGNIYFGYKNKLLAIDKEGNKKWEITFGQNQSVGTPSISPTGIIYVSAGKFRAISPAGEILWSSVNDVNTDSPGLPAAISPDGTIYAVGSRLGYPGLAYTLLYAFDEQGKQKWEKAISNRWDPYNSAAIVDETGNVYVVGFKYLLSYANNGNERWRLLVGYTPRSLSLANGIIYLPAQNGWLYAVGP
ncbi:MAG: PQQ-binding-like beta-propeller repeat protein [Minisyncoccales bacterium]